MTHQFQQPFTSLGAPQAQLAHYGLGGALGQVPFGFPYGQPYTQPSPFVPQGPIGTVGQALGQPYPFGYPYSQQQQFIPPTVNPLEVINIVARILPLLLQSSSLSPAGHISPFGMPSQLGSMFGQHPYTPLQSGLFQTPIGGLGSFGSPWVAPFAHY
jgi:hypothetical protein